MLEVYLSFSSLPIIIERMYALSQTLRAIGPNVSQNIFLWGHKVVEKGGKSLLLIVV
jgi:hypothetical protein